MIRRTLSIVLTLCVALVSHALAQEQEGGEPSAETLIQNGNLYLARGDCELAQFSFREALRLEPENAEALTGNGRALACRFNYPLAIDAFKKAIEVDPQHTQAYVQLARAYESQFQSDPERFPTRLSDALGALEAAERFAQDDPQVLNTKGVILYQMGDMQAARAALERAVDLAGRPDSGINTRTRSVMQVNLGKTYRELGELDLALGALRRAVVLDPINATARSNLGNIQYRLGNCESAEYELSQAAALDPGSLSIVADLAIALFECGQVQASIPYFEQALQIDGSVFLPPLYTYLSRGYVQLGRYDDAVRRAQQGAFLPPESADAFYWLGQAYQARGRDGDGEAARQAYERALQIDPSHSRSQEALGSLP